VGKLDERRFGQGRKVRSRKVVMDILSSTVDVEKTEKNGQIKGGLLGGPAKRFAWGHNVIATLGDGSGEGRPKRKNPGEGWGKRGDLPNLKRIAKEE